MTRMDRKKILVASNAMTNGGDWLILKNTLGLIDNFLGKKSYINRNIEKAEIDVESFQIPLYDAIIIPGGPQLMNRLLERFICPIVLEAMKEKKKIFLFGCGWYGSNDDSESLYGYEFSEESQKALTYIDENGILGCRDYGAFNLLKSKGYSNVMMTGCSVWYGKLDSSVQKKQEIRKLVISDIGISKDKEYQDQQIQQFDKVLRFLKKKFSGVEKIFTFNNGINTKYSWEFNKGIQQILEREQIPYYDLSYGNDTFSVYDDCDLHIGYRVHSHLYSLSHGIPSVLICEDARGMGMNRTLGFPVIRANSCQKQGGYESNPFILNELDSGINRLIENQAYEMERIRSLFQYYFNGTVTDYFKKIKQIY